MNRRNRRSVISSLKKDQKNIYAREKILTEQHTKTFGHNPFMEVFEKKKYWFVEYSKTGLSVAPSKTWKIRNFIFRIAYDHVLFGWFGYVLKFQNLAKRKPHDDVKLELLVTIYKYKKP